LKRRLTARTSVKRAVRHSLGVKAPRGLGIFTNPKKAFYNALYSRSSFSIDRLFSGGRRKSKIGGAQAWTWIIAIALAYILIEAYWKIILIVGIGVIALWFMIKVLSDPKTIEDEADRETD